MNFSSSLIIHNSSLNMKTKSFIFISSNLSRQLAGLASKMSKSGFDVIVAAPRSQFSEIISGFIGIPVLRMFRKTRLLSSIKLHRILRSETATVVAFDQPAAEMLQRLKIGFKFVPSAIGVNLSIYSPENVTPRLQNQFLDDQNIAEHQKMLTVVSRLGANMDILLSALQKIDRGDFVIALHGGATRLQAGRVMGKIRKSGQSGKILFLGNMDLAAMLRASFAIISLNTANDVPMMEALAMGRPNIWPDSNDLPKPNISFDSNDADSLSKAIETCLDMTPSTRTKIENKNLKSAADFSMEILADKLISGRK